MSDAARVLVVDDTPVNLKLLADLLNAKGYAVVTATSGAEALTRHGIPFRIDSTKDGGVTLVPHSRFDLKVRDEEREKAREILSALPEAAELELSDDAAEKDFEPGRGYRRCPGCAATLPFGALKCPECGLALEGSLEPLVCAKCGWEVSTADTTCPNCAAPLED